MISEAYGAGGNTAATCNNTYVAFYNATPSPVSQSGMSVQYCSASGTANPSGVAPLTGTVAAHGYYLVVCAAGTNGSALPKAPDQQNTGVNLSGTTRTVLLASQTVALRHLSQIGDGQPGDRRPGRARYLKQLQGSDAPASSVTTSIAHDAFRPTLTPTPRASSPAPIRQVRPRAGGTPPPPNEQVSIEQIQGAGS